MPLVQPMHIAVIVGSTREGRFAPTVTEWFVTRAALHPRVVLDVIDLADFSFSPVLRPRRGTDETAFAERIGRADAYVVITPEYNHGYPAPLKHAIDLCHAEWHRKAVAFVSYGGVSGGLRAVEQLRQVFAELHVTSVRDSVSFALARARFDDAGEPVDRSAAQQAVTTLMNELTWWADALRRARNPELAPAGAREDVA